MITLSADTLIKAGAVLGALAALLGYCVKSVKWYLRQAEQDKDIKAIKKENTLIVYALSAVILLMNLIVVCVITLLNLISSRDEIQLMRLIGISSAHVRQVYIVQNAILGLAATVLSLITSHLALLFVNNIRRAYGIVLNPLRFYPLELLIAGVVMLISVLPTIGFIGALSRRDALRK